ncbi:MAG: PilZ domain-containing protein [Candidatus Omnitrophica bacterium]|nr:PilZ domain-containing protein [Candidatus Omnitrophota bacterium]
MDQDRREYPRLDVSLRVSYRILESLGEHEQTVTQDVSERGVRIPLQEGLEEGTRLELAIYIPRDPEPVYAIGKVVWSRGNSGTQLFETGIHLVHIKQDDQDRLYKFALL